MTVLMPLNLQLKAVNMITVCLCIFHQNLKKRIPDTPLCYLCDTWLVLNLPASVSSSVKWGQCGWYPLHRVVVKTKSKQNTWTSTSHDEHLWPSHHQWGWGTSRRAMSCLLGVLLHFQILLQHVGVSWPGWAGQA